MDVINRFSLHLNVISLFMLVAMDLGVSARQLILVQPMFVYEEGYFNEQEIEIKVTHWVMSRL